jgi:small subunit ribosomal protein S8
VVEEGLLCRTLIFVEFVLENLPMKVGYRESKNLLGSLILSENTMDPISDFVIRLKNAGYAGKPSVLVPFSKIKEKIAKVLSNKGFVGEVSVKGKSPNLTYLEIGILYDEEGKPKINDVNRISKPSRRIYERSKNIKNYKRGYGISVLSTSKGVMTGVDARKQNLGGELLFTLW